ncbi:MAG: tyrosine-type recombinase/integrase [Allorhizobium sp.]
MPKALTVKAIEALKPKASRQEIADGGLSGLYLIVQPSGSMSWAIRYRFEGKPKKHTLGTYPAYGLAEAREEASKALRAVSEGRDPAGEKVRRKADVPEAGVTVNAALDDFIKRHIEKKNRPTTADENKRIIDKEVRPRWGEREVLSITRHEVIKAIDEVADRAPTMANRVLALLSKFFGWCVERDIIPASPMAKRITPPGQETSRERILTEDEIRLLWKACEKLGWPFGSLGKLLLLTAQRRNEVAEAERKEFNLAGNDQTWTVPKERTKNGKEHYVPLAASAIEAIETVPEVKSDQKPNKRYLLSTTGETPISGFSKGKKAIDAAMLKIAKEEAVKRGEDPDAVKVEPWTFHDLRRTAASGMARLGVPVQVVEAVLNHQSGSIKGVARVYNRYEYGEEKRSALEKWAGYVRALNPPGKTS